MSDDAVKAAEKRGYSRGYTAGIRRVVTEDERKEHRQREEERRDRFFCAALNGLLPTAGWTMQGKDLSKMEDYVELAARFADASLKALNRRNLP